MSKEISPNNKIIDFFKLQLFFLSKHFQILIIAIFIGIMCGFMMVLFNYLLMLFELGFSFIPYYFISPVIAGASTSLLVKYGKFSKVLGNGANEFIEETTTPVKHYNRASSLLAKSMATSWTFGSGMICGIEDPGILIGANIGHLISEKFGLNKEEEYLFMGASGCTGAILKAPISGALFCAELPYYNHIKYQSLLPSIIASTVAYFIFCLFFGFTPLIQTSLSSINLDWGFFITLLPFLLIFGIITGFIILIIMGLLRGFQNELKGRLEKKKRLWMAPLIGATIYSILLFFLEPFVLTNQELFIGQNTSSLSNITLNASDLGWLFMLIAAIMIILMIFCSIGTLNSAGIILPLMFLGALLGGVFGTLFYPTNPEIFVLIGISAVLGAATNNPISATIMIIEMTWVPFLFIPAGITSIITYIFSGPSSILFGQRSVRIKLK